jgi:predicted cupin superfamily sugar epimerase
MQFRIQTIRYLLTEDQASHWHETKDKVIKSTPLKRHRASSDAAILQKTYALIQEESQKIV